MRYKIAVQIFDISVPVRSDMPVYPGDPEVRLERVQESPAVSRLDFGVHSGTHVDAPVHFIEGGSGTEALPLEVLVGPCEVVGAGEEWPESAERILFKQTTELDGPAAQTLVAGGVRLVGVDRMSVGHRAVHEILLGAGVVVVEGLDLSGVDTGEYELYCLPLRLVGSDGAPARAILIKR